MTAGSKILDVLKGTATYPPPVWMMRQAGRYLPEYRELRRKAGSFLDLCYNPDLAVEISLQPIRRFGFDAAIVFSDILVVPHALGRDLSFVVGQGPRMTPIGVDEIDRLDVDGFHANLEAVYETLRRLRAELPAETALLGFCGAPWTVATYMIAGHGTSDQAPARLFGYRHPEAFARLLALLADCSAQYLIRQIEAGAQAFYSAVFAEKDTGREKPVAADFVGIHLPDRYVFGFGMDVHGFWRNLPAVYALKDGEDR